MRLNQLEITMHLNGKAKTAIATKREHEISPEELQQQVQQITAHLLHMLSRELT